MNPKVDFSLEPYFESIKLEFASLGITVSIREKSKAVVSNIESAFLKSDTVWRELVVEDMVLQYGLGVMPGMKIKIEVDRKPPLGFETEEKLLLRPYSFYVKIFNKESLFAGKMHALLFRKWKTRVKGRDWFDLEWYIRKGIPLDIHHFLLRAKDSGDWKGSTITKEQVLELLKNKIENVSVDRIKEDVIRFIGDDAALEIWSSQYFLDLITRIKFKS